MSSHEPRRLPAPCALLSALLALFALFALTALTSGCCGGDDEDDPPPAAIFNGTPYYLHIFHPDEVFLYVPPNSNVEVDVKSTSGGLVVATAAGQAVEAKATGPVPQCCSTDCGSVSVSYSSGSGQLTFMSHSPHCGGDGSCPHIYVRGRAGRFELQGEVLTGALNSGAMRPDALVLSDAARDHRGRYSVRIATERQERDLVEAAWLELVEHPSGTRVVADHTGRALALRDLVAPTRADDLRGDDQRRHIREADEQRWIGRLPAGDDSYDHLQLAFRRPSRADPGTLVLRARNTRFAEETYHAFLGELGPGLPKLMRLLGKLPFYRPTLDWLTVAGGLTLEVQRLEGAAWVTVAHLPLLGAVAPREVAVPLPPTIETLSGAQAGTGLERIRLRTLAGAWEVDRVQMTFSPPAPVRLRQLEAVEAQREDGRRWAIRPDAAFTRERLTPGQHLTLSFAAPPIWEGAGEGQRTTALLRIVGYYELLEASTRRCLVFGKLAKCLSPAEGNFATYMRSKLRQHGAHRRRIDRLLALDRAGRLPRTKQMNTKQMNTKQMKRRAR